MSKLITRKSRSGFYHDLFVLVLPIVIQNLISSCVSLADVVMLGQVNQTALSASSLAGQVQFLLNILYFGLNSALVILASQYWGKGDRKTISKILGIGLIISMIASTAAAVLAIACPTAVMHIWTNDPELIKSGAEYLRFVSVSYLCMGISQMYLSIMKSCERVKLPTAVSTVALVSNVILNAILIFGLFGAPKMGLAGAAIATSIARAIELAICIVHFMKQSLIPKSIRNMFTIPKTLLSDFAHYSLPALVNDAMWGLAFNMNSIIMGHLGSDIVAANSVVTTVRDLCTTLGFSISAASSILIGKELGENKMGEARKDSSSIMFVSFISSVAAGLVIFVLTPVIPGMVAISDTAAGYLKVMLYINVFYQGGQIINTVLIASLFRAGGQSRYGMILDIICMWCWAVPAGLISAFVLKLPPLAVYAIMCTDEFVKLPFALHHYKSGTWLKNLTRSY